jgi:hypothetical protein
MKNHVVANKNHATALSFMQKFQQRTKNHAVA